MTWREFRDGLEEWTQFARTFFLNLVIIIAVVSLIVVVMRELVREPVIVEEFSLPPSLTELGYSGAVTAQRLWDAVKVIHDRSTTHKTKTDLLAANRQLDISAPGVGISLQQFAQALRSMLNLSETRIAGEVLCATPDCEQEGLRLRLRVFLEGQLYVVRMDPMGDLSLDEYFHASAMEVLSLIDPYLPAAYLYYYEFNRAAAMNIAEGILRREHPESPWAANLIGNYYKDTGDPLKAMEFYDLAIALSEELGHEGFSLPHKNAGLALLNMGGVNKAAITRFERALKLDRNNFENWRALGEALLLEGQAAEALKMLDRSVNLSPDGARTWISKGRALLVLERHQEAFEKFQNAVDARPIYVGAYGVWRESLDAYLSGLAEPARCTVLEFDSPDLDYLRNIPPYIAEDFRRKLAQLRASCSLPMPFDIVLVDADNP